MIAFVEVAIGSGGMVVCSRCCGGPGGISYRPEADVVADLRVAVRDWPGGTGPNISLSGAEPFGHPSLPRLVGEAIDSGAVRLRLVTDAVALGMGENASGSLSAGVRHVRFALLGGSPGVHDVLVDTPGAFDAAFAGVAAFRAAAELAGLEVCVTAVVPVCRHNLRDASSAVAVAAKAGASVVSLVIADPGIDLAQASRWMASALDTGMVNSVWTEAEGMPYCLLPGHELNVVPRGAEPGAKAPACAGCALDGVCAGGPAGAAPDALGSLAPPIGAQRLAARVGFAAGGGAP